jgi:predicted nucleotidyltransferase
LAEPINILHPSVAEMLKAMEKVFREFDIDFFLVGAAARDIQLSAGKGIAALRKTKDIDIAVMLNDEEQFYTIKDALLATGHFKETANNSVKLIYQEGIEADLLPFGEIENADRELQLNRHTLLVMDMTGFKEVYPFAETIKITNELTLNVCTPEGLIILKLIANNDNPSRTKDISDIEHLLNVYFELHADEIYSEYMDAMDLYDTGNNDYLQLVSARVTGRKIKMILAEHTKTTEHIKTILAKRPLTVWRAMLDGLIDEY